MSRYRWSQRHWWYIERPFPWPYIMVVLVVAAILIGGAVAAC